MIRLPDASAAEWLLAALVRAGGPEWRVPPYPLMTPAQLIPPIYEAYAVIFHGIEQEVPPRHEGSSWDAWKRVESGAQAEGEPPALQEMMRGSTLVRGGGTPDGPVRRVLWQELATGLDLPYTPQLTEEGIARAFGGSWPRDLFGPAEGRLDEAQIEALAEVLSRHSPTPEAFFRYWWLAGGEFSGNDIVYRGELTEVPALLAPPFHHQVSPSHWFPTDRGWCVGTDYDSCITLVGGTRALIRDILACPDLEALPVEAKERLYTPPEEAGA